MQNLTELVSGTLAHIAQRVNLPDDDQQMIVLVLKNVRDLVDSLIAALEEREVRE